MKHLLVIGQIATATSLCASVSCNCNIGLAVLPCRSLCIKIFPHSLQRSNSRTVLCQMWLAEFTASGRTSYWFHPNRSLGHNGLVHKVHVILKFSVVSPYSFLLFTFERDNIQALPSALVHRSSCSGGT